MGRRRRRVGREERTEAVPAPARVRPAMDAVEAELEARFAAAVDAMRESEGATVGLRDRIVNVVGEEAAEEQVRQAREAEARKASERPPKAPPARGEGRIFTG